jgi:tRNA modification GTPase
MANDQAAMTKVACSVLTAAGRGAIAVVRVCGPGSDSIVDDCFAGASGRPLSAAPPNAIRFGMWRDSGEEVVACRRASDDIELHCHGGAAAVRAILRSLEVAGVGVFAAPSSEVSTYFAGVSKTRPQPPTCAEAAWQELPRALTQRTAGILLDQANGALDRELAEIDGLDKHDAPAAQARRDQLLKFAPLGEHLTKPWQVVLAGPPNAGKSSLANALLGYGRSIVFNEPGTTREVVTTTSAIDGWPVAISDTAGLRETHDPLEAAGVEQTISKLAAADLVIHVSPSDEPAAHFEAPGSTPCLHVISKIDLRRPHVADGVLATSVVTGEGIAELLAAISRSLVPEAPPAGAAVMFSIG